MSEATDRLRAALRHYGQHGPEVQLTCSQADLRALLDEADRLQAGLEGIRNVVNGHATVTYNRDLHDLCELIDRDAREALTPTKETQ